MGKEPSSSDRPLLNINRTDRNGSSSSRQNNNSPTDDDGDVPMRDNNFDGSGDDGDGDKRKKKEEPVEKVDTNWSDLLELPLRSETWKARVIQFWGWHLYGIDKDNGADSRIARSKDILIMNMRRKHITKNDKEIYAEALRISEEGLFKNHLELDFWEELFAINKRKDLLRKLKEVS